MGDEYLARDEQPEDGLWLMVRRWAARSPSRAAVLVAFLLIWNGWVLWMAFFAEHPPEQEMSMCLLAALLGVLSVGFAFYAIFYREFFRLQETINPLVRWWRHPAQRDGELQVARWFPRVMSIGFAIASLWVGLNCLLFE